MAYIHVYTGNGKGKTTAAMGLLLRALGAGMKVCLVQFLKVTETSELEALRRFMDQLWVKRYGSGKFVVGEPSEEDRREARQGLKEAAHAVSCGLYDLVVLDEVCVALYFKLLSVDEVMKMLQNRAPATEVVLTGRYAPKELVGKADLVTEMVEVKHYFNEGVEGRKGIEK